MKWLDGFRIELMSFGLITAMVLSRINPANGAMVTVGPEAGYDFNTIQAGIDAAVDGDTVLVAPGEYVITEPITFRGKAITVRSDGGRDQTTIRMGTPADHKRGSVVIFENNETEASVLDGFCLTGGIGTWGEQPDQQAGAGGGIAFNGSSGTVQNCAIVRNNSTAAGGIMCGYECSVTVTDCIIAENSAEENVGGVFVWRDASLTLTNCIIAGNTALYDGGVACARLGSSLTMRNCTICRNSATDQGGGLGCYEGASVTATNCIITGNTSGNTGGVICLLPDSFLTMRNCTIWKNSATDVCGGLACALGASTTVTNCILWGNTSPDAKEMFIYQGSEAPPRVSVDHSNVAGGRGGVHIMGDCTLNWCGSNINTDPFFANPGYWADINDPNVVVEHNAPNAVWVEGDYHLRSQAGRWDPTSENWVQDDVTSLCIDAGDPMSPIGRERFPNGGFINMGAYGGTPKASKSYFGQPVCETIVAGDINGDGQVNRADLMIMAFHWTDEVPLPLP